jgi:hypothetical protein
MGDEAKVVEMFVERCAMQDRQEAASNFNTLLDMLLTAFETTYESLHRWVQLKKKDIQKAQKYLGPEHCIGEFTKWLQKSVVGTETTHQRMFETHDDTLFVEHAEDLLKCPLFAEFPCDLRQFWVETMDDTSRNAFWYYIHQLCCASRSWNAATASPSPAELEKLTKMTKCISQCMHQGMGAEMIFQQVLNQ